jgi:shikimate kinase
MLNSNKNHSLLFLCGFMGCGNSSIGKKLARKLAYDFVDLDRYIEREEQASLNQIFGQMGELHFRNLETKYLNKLVLLSNTVVALGGGTPCFNENMKLISAFGTSFYIKLNEITIFQRLLHNQHERPLIAGFNHDELQQYIKLLLQKREVYYQACDFTINGLQNPLVAIEKIWFKSIYENLANGL